MDRCPNCGACKECGHVPAPYPWFQPYYVPVHPVTQPPAWFGVQPPPYTVTWGGNTSIGISTTSLC